MHLVHNLVHVWSFVNEFNLEKDELGSLKFSQMKLVSKQTYNLNSLKHALQGRFWGPIRFIFAWSQAQECTVCRSRVGLHIFLDPQSEKGMNIAS